MNGGGYSICITPGVLDTTECSITSNKEELPLIPLKSEAQVNFKAFLAYICTPAHDIPTKSLEKGTDSTIRKLQDDCINALGINPIYIPESERTPFDNNELSSADVVLLNEPTEPVTEAYSQCYFSENNEVLFGSHCSLSFESFGKACNEWQEEANRKNKTIITPIGLLHRPGILSEDHEVLLVCRPNQRPRIYDSNHSGSYKNVEVIFTGRQGRLDIKNCWRYVLQEATYMISQLNIGVPPEKLRSYTE
ncbi:hypothetical protein A6J66_000965 [Yersinia enterocolitica]|nr:hypothetical protein A6J66_000965 [Yersinia enterocolitica]